jgi:ankyrin repeat protein
MKNVIAVVALALAVTNISFAQNVTPFEDYPTHENASRFLDEHCRGFTKKFSLTKEKRPKLLNSCFLFAIVAGSKGEAIEYLERGASPRAQWRLSTDSSSFGAQWPSGKDGSVLDEKDTAQNIGNGLASIMLSTMRRTMNEMGMDSSEMMAQVGAGFNAITLAIHMNKLDVLEAIIKKDPEVVRSQDDFLRVPGVYARIRKNRQALEILKRVDPRADQYVPNINSHARPSRIAKEMESIPGGTILGANANASWIFPLVMDSHLLDAVDAVESRAPNALASVGKLLRSSREGVIGFGMGLAEKAALPRDAVLGELVSAYAEKSNDTGTESQKQRLTLLLDAVNKGELSKNAQAKVVEASFAASSQPQYQDILRAKFAPDVLAADGALKNIAAKAKSDPGRHMAMRNAYLDRLLELGYVQEAKKFIAEAGIDTLSVAQLHKLLDKDAVTNFELEKMEAAHIAAASADDKEGKRLLARLAERGLDMNAANPNGLTPLHALVYGTNDGSAALEEGIRLGMVPCNQAEAKPSESLVTYAVNAQRILHALAIYEKQQNPNSGELLVILAGMIKKGASPEELIETYKKHERQDINLNRGVDKNGSTLLMLAASNYCSAELMEFFISKGAKADKEDRDGLTAADFAYNFVKKKLNSDQGEASQCDTPAFQRQVARCTRSIGILADNGAPLARSYVPTTCWDRYHRTQSDEVRIRRNSGSQGQALQAEPRRGDQNNIGNAQIPTIRFESNTSSSSGGGACVVMNINGQVTRQGNCN